MKRKICFMLFILLVLLNVYDVYSTNTLLNSGVGFYEANPVVNFLMHRFGQMEGMIILKGALLIWIFTFLFRAKTKRMWNILTVALIAATSYYAAGMYFLNYKSMLFLGGMS